MNGSTENLQNEDFVWDNSQLSTFDLGQSSLNIAAMASPRKQANGHHAGIGNEKAQDKDYSISLSPEIIDALEELFQPPTFRKPASVIMTDKRTGEVMDIKAAPMYEFAEHQFIGDVLELKDENGINLPRGFQFSFQSGVVATYGTINAMAGDFYGTDKPICLGGNSTECFQRFLAAYNSLARCADDRVKNKFAKIYALLQGEIKAVDADPSHSASIYSRLPDLTLKFEAITFSRPSGFPAYIGLAAINFDHFGKDAHLAWWHGHQLAMKRAASGKTRANLLEAYTLNAFADHFLEDSFSAGHLRTPRRYLSSTVNKAYDLCSKFMHDEDNAIGIEVNNAQNLYAKWKVYGDKMLLEPKNAENRERLRQTLQRSVDEVYIAWQNQRIPGSDQQKVLSMVPTISSAQGPQTLQALFKSDGKTRRATIKNRRTTATTTYWTAVGTAAECKLSGWWNFRIGMDGGGLPADGE